MAPGASMQIQMHFNIENTNGDTFEPIYASLTPVLDTIQSIEMLARKPT
jgi:hypothetical protein